MKISEEEKREKRESFGLRFRLLMGYHNLTLKDIAAATQNAISTVSTWKNGRIPSSPETIKCLAKQFRVSPAFLLCGCHNHVQGPFQRDWEAVSACVEGKAETDKLPCPAPPLLAEQILAHLEAYIRKASAFPYLLEHLWIQLQKEFPLGDIPAAPEAGVNFSKKN
ncbi:MAG: helix-turn-helix domain-containing protein [Puniceicoccales bacterium]|jgi:transcriptional regulator with XRE-family HTH domain|nr:helix-turn-helix domain-containing protein [Puniceicoccales bacterium]